MNALFSWLLPGLAAPFLYLLITKYRCSSYKNLPPGSMGWPVAGESLAFIKSSKTGRPEAFTRDRMKKYGSPPAFKTAIMGERMVVFTGPGGNKFLFGNESKLVAVWWPVTVQRLFGTCLISMAGEEAKRTRKVMMSFLNPEALSRYITVMDEVTLHHIASRWDGKEEVKVYSNVKLYTFELACRLFMCIEDPHVISKLAAQFNVFLKGIIALPINIPGAQFYKSMRAADAIRKELQAIVRERKIVLEENKASPHKDLLSHLLVNVDENGKFMSETEIINNILTLLFAGHDTSSSTIMLVMKYLAELPQVYDNVFKEQNSIAASKASGELLTWEDIQKMKYSWNVISEVMRLNPPVVGSFREALVDFTYEGYTIPKGWKLYWSAAWTHKDPCIFSETTTFDTSRFEGDGPLPFSYVPFGGGPRMCLGKEYARIEMLVFMHNIINKFKWKLKNPNEKIIYDPMPTPLDGLPVSLQPLSPLHFN